jgi:hypothetical protein
MTTNIGYTRGTNTGGIFDNECKGSVTWIACTATTSKTFKTRAGAERFMKKYGYEPKKITIKK